MNRLSYAIAAGLASLAATAHAGTIAIGPLGSDSLTATSVSLAATAPFALADLGSAGGNGLVSTAPIELADGGRIVFTPDASTPQGGLYAGSTTDVAMSPFTGTALAPSNYLVAEPNDPVTVDFGLNNTSQSFSLLWGSVDAYNVLNLDFCVGSTELEDLVVTGTEVAQAANILANGTESAFVTIDEGFLQGYDEIVFTSTSPAFEFEPSVAVPEPASFAVLGVGLLGLALRRRAARA